ncbi:MAG: hypothetical protein HYT21_02530 [Candidatus Nealsonbacteria bacterium]|nr:hypothetical protein [Candidatus Nealsonbacteria bacterium]
MPAEKIVIVKLEWSSLDGRAEFRPVYSDGTKDRIVSTTIELGTPATRREMTATEREWIGREKP